LSSEFPPFIVGGQKLIFVDKFKYLCHIIISAKKFVFDFAVSGITRKIVDEFDEMFRGVRAYGTPFYYLILNSRYV